MVTGQYLKPATTYNRRPTENAHFSWNLLSSTRATPEEENNENCCEPDFGSFPVGLECKTNTCKGGCGNVTQYFSDPSDSKDEVMSLSSLPRMLGTKAVRSKEARKIASMKWWRWDQILTNSTLTTPVELGFSQAAATADALVRQRWSNTAIKRYGLTVLQ